MTPEIKIFPDPEAVAEAVAAEGRRLAQEAAQAGQWFSLVLAGGRTPRRVYETLARDGVRDAVPWNGVHLFWGDERCVPPDHPESNYRMVREALIESVPLPQENIHRIFGEHDPLREAARYAEEIRTHMTQIGRQAPRFDWILLGVGTDGHTASLFPGMEVEEEPSGICGVAVHPETGQERITLTEEIINLAARIAFIVTGSEKAAIVADLLSGNPLGGRFPAGRIDPKNGILTWYLDEAAASRLRR